jgi:hypothetical protein
MEDLLLEFAIGHGNFLTPHIPSTPIIRLLYNDQFSDRALHRQRSASGDATRRFRNRRQTISQENSMIVRKIMHKPSGVVRAFDQVLVFPLDVTARSGEIAVEDGHHVPGKK